MTSAHKLVSIEEARALAERARAGGKRVVAASGSFDIMHAGHVHLLESAKEQGDVLFILVNTDDSVRAYKGMGRPFVPEKSRMALVAAIACVDYVVPLPEITTRRALSELRPHIFYNGPDRGPDCIERAWVSEWGGVIHIAPSGESIHSSDIVARIIDASLRPIRAAIFLNLTGLDLSDADTFAALTRLNERGYVLVSVANPLEVVRTCTERGVRVERAYESCDSTVFLRAAEDLLLSLDRSWTISSSPDDVTVGRLTNGKAVLVHSAGHLPEMPIGPTRVTATVALAAEAILGAL